MIVVNTKNRPLSEWASVTAGGWLAKAFVELQNRVAWAESDPGSGLLAELNRRAELAVVASRKPIWATSLVSS
jgi:hypothetical protein